MLRVKCSLTDCVRYSKPKDPTAFADDCDCSHPDKHMYMQQRLCPLYKKEWSAMDTSALADRFKRKRVG